MKTITTFLILILVLGFLSAIVYGGYMAIGYLWSLYLLLDIAVRIILLSAMAVILLGSVIIAGAIRSAAQAKSQLPLTEAKLTFYKSLVGLYEQYITSEKLAVEKSKSELLTRLAELESDMLILAGASVLDIHGKLVTAIGDQDDEQSINNLFQQLIRTIRRDLGHGHDESRLKFLVNASRTTNVDHPNPGVST